MTVFAVLTEAEAVTGVAVRPLRLAVMLTCMHKRAVPLLLPSTLAAFSLMVAGDVVAGDCAAAWVELINDRGAINPQISRNVRCAQ
jgi:hypothetical protein